GAAGRRRRRREDRDPHDVFASRPRAQTDPGPEPGAPVARQDARRRLQQAVHLGGIVNCTLPLVVKDASPLIPSRPTVKKLQIAAAGCQACDLWKIGTQTVFGEGEQASTVMFIGEQPGDREDLAGRPFVGPAGGLLDKALVEPGIDRTKAYVTNVVKHFKWEPRGKRRIHK